ncbi:mandelate racemase/muconate lactonizing enzyme family protein [Candidatus Poriferisodalis sp.]|uniref:mandelate racemase/muconate lactonizing enzyme family protein n=1 Tax=Candidatus Poriferisodalis sp. TaxID=3101277 RepID=UPI003D12CFC1
MTPTIVEVTAAPLRRPEVLGRTAPPSASWDSTGMMHALSSDRSFAGQAMRFEPPWDDALCVVTASDGSFGVGMTSQAGPVMPIINDFFGPMIVGESVLAIERLWNMMSRSANSAFGAAGLAAYALSAVDLALWDLKGKVLGRPVYELMGGPARERTRCYATGNDLDDSRNRGFDAFKLAGSVGPGSGTAGITETERLVASARSELGPDADIMLDCWSSLDASYAVRLGEALAPYRLTWIEDYAQPDDWPGYADVRRRLPTQMLAAGERWLTDRAFAYAAQQRLVDVLQPDVQWVGGATAVLRIAAIAASSGIELALHGGSNDSYGQHLCHALAQNRWAEMYVGCPPGESLMNAWRSTPGMSLPDDGWLVPSEAPGFGIELTSEQIDAAVGQADS